MNRQFNRHSQYRTGASSVEFALIFPIIITFFMAMIGMTQAFLLQDTAQHAAYEAARNGLVIDTTSQEVESAANDFCRSMGVSSATVEIDPAVITASTRDVTVRVTVPLSANSWIALPFFPEDWSVRSEITLSRNLE